MKKLLLIAFLALSFLTTAQTYNLKQDLPIDANLKKGVLSNGMTYYIYNTDVVKDAASYYIIQNVGSILEEDDQQGLAHFLEHMAFNGTKNFPGKSLLSQLEEKGLQFGKDINAYTSFDETVYNVDNLKNTEDQIDLGLQVLYDWSNEITLKDEEIDAERGVIKEEWRSRQSGGMRLMEKTLPVTFAGSKYKDRLPIGLMPIVENFDYKTLRDFYHDWYRTDLQAIAVVGDIDVEEIEQKIIAKFSSIPAVENPKERYYVKFSDYDETKFITAKDKEIAKSQISFSIHSDKTKDVNKVLGLKIGLEKNIITNILNARLSEITKQPDAPAFSVGYSTYNITPQNSTFSFYVNPKPNQQAAAFKLAMEELQRAVKFGFLDVELAREKKRIYKYYDKVVKEKEDRSHRGIINSIKNDYLGNEIPVDLTKQLDYVKQLFKTITTKDIHNALKKIYTKQNRNIVATGVEGENNLTKSKVFKIIKNAENNKNLEAYVLEKDDRPLLEGITLTPGTVVNKTHNQDLDFTTFTLSNGIRVHYVFSDKQKNKVNLNITSKGGYSLVAKEDIPSALMAYQVLPKSGLGAFTSTELQNKLSDKNVSVSSGLGIYSEFMSGYSDSESLHTMLQLVAMRFVAPRFDEDAFQTSIESEINRIETDKKDINAIRRDSTIASIYGKDDAYNNPVNAEQLKTVSLEKIEHIYKKRFENPADFEFFIGGDIKKEALIKGLELYIAGLSTMGYRENWKAVDSKWLKNNIKKTIYLPMENEKATVNIHLKNDLTHSRKQQYILLYVAKLLKLRFTESLREEKGGTYGASAFASLSREPKDEAHIRINFDCNPDLVDDLVGIVHEEIEKMRSGEFSKEDFKKVRESILKEREDLKNRATYNFLLMQAFVKDGVNADLPKNFTDIINTITTEDIQTTLEKVLNNHKATQLVFKPKK